MQKAPAPRSLGQLDDRTPTQNATRAGSSDTEVKELTAKPTGFPEAIPVTTVTPVAKWPRTWRNRASSIPLEGSAVPVASIRPG